ncbi:MAG: leucyl/phenylalanyl-tRNA--protein transferase [Solirubrobacterales bacterium]
MEYIKSIDKRFFRGGLKSCYRLLLNRLNSNSLYIKHIKYKGKAPILRDNMDFPPHESSNKTVRLGPFGELLAIGGGLEPERMINAYKKGVCQISFKNEPVLWWTAPIRCVVLPNGIHISKIMKRKIFSGNFSLTVDKAFSDVVNSCANTRENYTWLTNERKKCCFELHKLGIAHSVEVWENGSLIGGLFGVSLGSYFLGESMFSLKRDAAKLAFIGVSMRLCELGYSMFDLGIWPTEYLTSLGAACIDRDLFLEKLNSSVDNVVIHDFERIFEDWDYQQAVKNKLKEEI